MNAFTLSLIRGNFATVQVCMKVKTTTIRSASRFSLPCAWAAFRHGDFLPGKSGAYRSELPGPDRTSIAGPISGLGA